MEFCASAASMLAEEFWQIAEGFLELPVNLQVQIKNVDGKSYIGKTILWKKCFEDIDILQNVESKLCGIIHKVQSAICLLTKYPQCGKYANETSTMWKVF